MAITVTPVSDASTSPAHRVFDITATADGDTVATITHGLDLSLLQPAAGPSVDAALQVEFEPIDPAFYISNWVVTSRVAGTNTQVTITKGTGAGSGVAGKQVRVHCKRQACYGQ